MADDLLQTIQIPIDGGQDSKSDPHGIPIGKMASVQNCVFNRGSGLSKRNGYTALDIAIVGSSTTSLSNAKALAVYEDELLQFANSKFYSYSSAKGGWIDKGSYVSASISKSTVIRNSYTQTCPDMGYQSNLLLLAWQDTRGGIYASFVDTNTGTSLVLDTQVSSTGILPRCLVLGNYFFVVYIEGTNVKHKRIDPNNNTLFESAVTLASDVDGTIKLLDAIEIGGNGVFCYSNNAAGIGLGYVKADGTLGTSLNGLADAVSIASTPETCLTIYSNIAETKIYIAFHNTATGLVILSRGTDLTVSLAATTVQALTSPVVKNVTLIEDSSSNILILYEVNNASTHKRYIRKNTLTLPSTMGTAATVMLSVGLASKAWIYNSINYVNIVHDSTLQATYFTIDSSGNVAAKYLPTEAGGTTSSSVLPSVQLIETGEYSWLGLEKTKLVSVNDNVYTLTGVSRLTIDFAANDTYFTQELGRNLLIGGGFLSMYDGKQTVEHNFNLYPENVTAAASNSTGTIANGTYSHKVCYEWTDNRGQVHYSSPSVGVTTVLTGTDDTITLTIPTLRITGKSVVCGVYRTLTLGSTWYKCGTVANDTTADTVSFTDTFPDASISVNEQLYTNGGVVENQSSPATSVISTYKNRLLVVRAEDPLTIWYSKTRYNNEPVTMSQDFQLTVKPDGGTITALWEMDANLIIFKANRILYLAGEGPNNAGQENDFGEPVLISSDVGCTNINSVVMTPVGLMFKSSKGIFLLDRSHQLNYIGADMEGYNSYEVTSAILVQINNQVRFTTRSNETLVYDYYYKKWSVFNQHAAQDGILWQYTYCYLKSTGVVMQETTSTFTDGNQSYKMKIKTPWIATAGFQGFQQILAGIILGFWYSRHVLDIRVYYDYEVTPYETFSYNYETVNTPIISDSGTPAGSTYSNTSQGVYQFRMNLGRQFCQAVQFEFEENQSTVYGQSFRLSSLQLEVKSKPGLYILPSGQQG